MNPLFDILLVGLLAMNVFSGPVGLVVPIALFAAQITGTFLVMWLIGHGYPTYLLRIKRWGLTGGAIILLVAIGSEAITI